MALTKFTEKLISDSFKTTISGSDTAESSSFASRVTLVEAGSTSKTLVSSSAQIADDISGSFSKEHLGAKVANVVTSSAQIAVDISGSFGNQRVGTSDSPTFAGGTITGDFSVGGTLTAQEIHTEFESASIIFTSGSTIFGNSTDDTHLFSGSVAIHNGEVGVAAGSSADELVIKNNGDAGISILSPDGNSSRIQFGSVSDNDIGHIGGYYNSGNEYLFFNVDGSARMVIGGATNAGNVGIGTANPGNNLHLHTDNSAEGILLKSTGDTRNNLIFDGNISSAADNIAFIDANWNGTNVARISMFTGTDTSNKDDGRIGFATAAAGTVAERMRIESDGRVAIKATSFPQDFGNARGHLLISSNDDAGANNYGVLLLQGHSISNDVATGGIYFYDHDNNTATIQVQRDDSTSKGNILFYTNGGSGVTERMQIQSDGVVTTQGDFKPGADVIMASGRGISFTATSNATGMSSELLDDYEEGVYDITIGGLGGGSIGLDSSKQALSYTKIGRQVTVQGEISVTSVSSLSGTMTINLPFSVGSEIGDLSSRTVGSFSSQNHNFNDFGLTIHSHTYAGQSVMYFVYHKDNGGWEYVNTNTLASNTEFRVSLTYFTN